MRAKPHCQHKMEMRLWITIKFIILRSAIDRNIHIISFNVNFLKKKPFEEWNSVDDWTEGVYILDKFNSFEIPF